LTQESNILVIDDEVITLKMTKIGLERLGYVVAVFSKPKEAIAYFEEHHSIVKLVITDKNMPNISGVDILKKFKEIDANIPIIVLTGFIESEEDRQLLELGAYKNLLKPISLKELSVEIRAALSLS
jgi:DNA-binding response OmpR family regulator